MGKPTWAQRVQCLLLAVFLGVMVLLYIFLPKSDFSTLEKRELSQFPELDQNFGAKMETYLSDHLPGRSFFLGVDAYWNLVTGRRVEIYAARGGRLVEAPAEMGRGLKNIDYVNQFQEKTGLPVDLLLVPSAGFLMEASIYPPHRPYRDGEILAEILKKSRVSAVSVDYKNPEALFYRTDHHWTSLGAFTACNAYLAQLGKPELEREDFEIQVVPDFYGSTYCRSCLWLTAGEALEIWRSPAKIQVEGASGLFDMEKAAGADKYAIFLGGNQPLVRLKNPAQQGKILVLRDSFGSCFAPFLAQRFGEVVLLDLRYDKESVARLCTEENFDRVLVLYGLNTFLTDGSFVFLGS